MDSDVQKGDCHRCHTFQFDFNFDNVICAIGICFVTASPVIFVILLILSEVITQLLQFWHAQFWRFYTMVFYKNIWFKFDILAIATSSVSLDMINCWLATLSIRLQLVYCSDTPMSSSLYSYILCNQKSIFSIQFVYCHKYKLQ